MKLLPQKEIDSKVNDQKKEKIDAGLFLARKIDALREELLELENERDLFIAGSQKTIDEALEEGLSKKNQLEITIRDLEEKRLELLKPLDEEWTKVNLKSEENRNATTSLFTRGLEVERKEEEILFKEKSLDERESKILTLEKLCEESLKKSKNREQESDLLVKNSEDRAKKMNVELNARTDEILIRENGVKYREIDVENKLQIIHTKEKQIEKDYKHIEAQRRSLTAAYAELHK